VWFEQFDPLTADFTYIGWLGDRKGIKRLNANMMRARAGDGEAVSSAIRGAWGSTNWRRCQGSVIGKQKSGTPKSTLDIHR
jgi:hypothetical protein